MTIERCPVCNEPMDEGLFATGVSDEHGYDCRNCGHFFNDNLLAVARATLAAHDADLVLPWREARYHLPIGGTSTTNHFSQWRRSRNGTSGAI